MTEIVEIRLLPPFAIARLGSSPEAMEEYELEPRPPFGPRIIKPVQESPGDAFAKNEGSGPQVRVQFRDTNGKIKPVAPFFEVWARFKGTSFLVPLTRSRLADANLKSEDVRWSVTVANAKAFRRTGDPNDKIVATLPYFSDHAPKPLEGSCANFLPGKSILLGSVVYINPVHDSDRIRLRFTPAGGRVYGPPRANGERDSNLADAVYNPRKGWNGYSDPVEPKIDSPLAVRRTTQPPITYADDGNGVSLGYLDDECDGIIEVQIVGPALKLAAFARIAVGPPVFAPDCRPVRSVYDDLEQAHLGPDLEPQAEHVGADVREILMRVLDAVRLTNTAEMNKASMGNGAGMAKMDTNDYNRALEPISDPAIVDTLAIQARHERLLVALDSGSLAWFARFLRDYNQVGDLSDEGRRRMPALLRGSDARHLALTRRQVNKVRAAAADHELARQQVASRPTWKSADRIEAMNITAQLQYEAPGNPPTAHPDSATSACHPGLEMDFRNVWRRILTGIELHESSNLVTAVEPDADPQLRILASGWRLLSIMSDAVTVPVVGPKHPGGDVVPLVDFLGDSHLPLESSNALARVLHQHAGKAVMCKFQSLVNADDIRQFILVMRPFFEQAVIARELLKPGELSQSLCSPWQTDYRECACFYWPATRPDYINVEPGPGGESIGHNWMQKRRTPTTPKVYTLDDWFDPTMVSFQDLYRNWETSLEFIIGGEDETHSAKPKPDADSNPERES